MEAWESLVEYKDRFGKIVTEMSEAGIPPHHTIITVGFIFDTLLRASVLSGYVPAIKAGEVAIQGLIQTLKNLDHLR